MGAVKRTHRKARIQQQAEKEFRKLLQRNPILAADKMQQFLDAISSAIKAVIENLKPLIDSLVEMISMKTEQFRAGLLETLENSKVEDPLNEKFVE